MGRIIRAGMWVNVAPGIMGTITDDGREILHDIVGSADMNPRDIDDKITVYERQMCGWFLDRATRFARGENNGFIILMIGIAYIEGAQQLREGNTSRGGSKDCFRRGLRRIFNIQNEVTDIELNGFYDQVRCGLFHSGMTRDRVIISGTFEGVIDFSEDNTIRINQREFIKTIKRDLRSYVRQLRNPRDREGVRLRPRFDQMFRVLG